MLIGGRGMAGEVTPMDLPLGVRAYLCIHCIGTGRKLSAKLRVVVFIPTKMTNRGG